MKVQCICVDVVREKIDCAEKILHECFNMLLDFKHARGDIDNILTNFQPKLAECLYDLMLFYQKLCREKDNLISSKGDYENNEFATIMSINASFLEIVKKTIEIGKNLGDAYAWFFYRNNRAELDKHFEHPSTGLYIGGIGGLGELEFIKNANYIEGLYVIYHGITTMLRVGDFSLYDREKGIVAVGELKTKDVDDTLEVYANITSKVTVVEPSDMKNNSFEKRISELEKDFPKIKKQIKAQSELIKAKQGDIISDNYTSYEYEVIDKLSKDNIVVSNRDNSLILVAIWSKESALFDVLSIKEEDVDYVVPADLINMAKIVVETPSPYNEMIVGSITTQMTRLNIPILWWEISDERCEELYFGKIAVVTCFNPAKLLQIFVDDGFVVSNFGQLKEININKEINGYWLGVGHFESVCYLITNNLMKTRDAYASFLDVIKLIESGTIKPNGKIDMHIYLSNFGRHK